jgi:hypothetical protein
MENIIWIVVIATSITLEIILRARAIWAASPGQNDIE